MAPREANHTFADQFLCMDFDGIGMLPNDPAPPQGGGVLGAAAAAAAGMVLDVNNAITGGDDDQAGVILAQQVLDVTMTGATTATSASGTGDDATTTSAAAPPVVDPLSIDPTQTSDDGDDDDDDLIPHYLGNGTTASSASASDYNHHNSNHHLHIASPPRPRLIHHDNHSIGLMDMDLPPHPQSQSHPHAPAHARYSESSGSLSTNISTNNNNQHNHHGRGHSNVSSSLLYSPPSAGPQPQRPAMVRRLVSQTSHASSNNGGLSQGNHVYSGMSIDLTGDTQSQDQMSVDGDGDDDVDATGVESIDSNASADAGTSVQASFSAARRVSLVRRSVTATSMVSVAGSPEPPQSMSTSTTVPPALTTQSPTTQSQMLSFGPNTTLTDLKYFAERGCIVALLGSLNTPKLTAQGSRLLADYAKNPTRRLAVAKNRRILEFTLRTMHGHVGGNPDSANGGSVPYNHSEEERTCRERAVEYAVETIRSLTATEESDGPLLQTPGLLLGLAAMAKGGHIGVTATGAAAAAAQEAADHDFSRLVHPQMLNAPSPRRVSDLSHHHGVYSVASGGPTPPPAGSYGQGGSQQGVVPLVSVSSPSRSYVRNISRSDSSGSEQGTHQSPVSVSFGNNGAATGNSFGSLKPPSPADFSDWPVMNSKTRLHACIAIMNLSCGKSNKVEIAKLPQILLAMRHVMMAHELDDPKSHQEPKAITTSSNASQHLQESRLKATTCIKNLSNHDGNDPHLLHTPGLIEAVGHAITVSLNHAKSLDDKPAAPIDQEDAVAQKKRCTLTVTNACLALMNLSIAKANKHRVFLSQGIMEALMMVLDSGATVGTEARIKSCSALSNLAIGYDNKIPMFHYPGFVESILRVIHTDDGEARTKACSILWSFAAEMRNQVPVVQRGDILPMLVRVAEEDLRTEARFKCVAALTLLAESMENAVPILESGALHPLMDILGDAGPDPTQWQGQTASWCVGFLMNIAQSDDAVESLRNAGVVEVLAPLLTLDHYQSLKAAMAVTFVCRYDEDDSTYDLLRKTESVIPKICALLTNTLAGKGGNGYKYGVFTLRSSVGCIASLASGPVFMKERMATTAVYESLLRVVSDFCVEMTPGAIVGGGREDEISATLAVQALKDLTGYLKPSPLSQFPFGPVMEERLILALGNFEQSPHTGVTQKSKQWAMETRMLLMGYSNQQNDAEEELLLNMAMAPANFCCSIERMCSPSPVHPFIHPMNAMAHTTMPPTGISNARSSSAHMTQAKAASSKMMDSIVCDNDDANLNLNLDLEMDMEALDQESSGDTASASSSRKAAVAAASSKVNAVVIASSPPVRTFLLSDKSGRRFAVPIDPSGGRRFNDSRAWCFRRGRFCLDGETADANFVWTQDLEHAYQAALRKQEARRRQDESAKKQSAASRTRSLFC
jgi:hypothetical protein